MNIDSPTPTGLPFLKMHGLGNDFVVIDARGGSDPMTPARVRAIGDRHRGIGFDQLVVLRDGQGVAAEVDYWNSDGSTAGACGNASRCVARLLMQESGQTALTIRTKRGELACEDAGNGLIRVNMGQPQLDWRDVPLSTEVDLNALPIDGAPGAAGMGNPHCVFVVDDADAVDLPVLGAKYERHALFPERTNVEFINIIDRETIRMRVWERGGIITQACGSGACAAAVVAHRKGLVDRKVTVILDGGPLIIDWREDGVWMTGPAALVAVGELSAEFLDAIR